MLRVLDQSENIFAKWKNTGHGIQITNPGSFILSCLVGIVLGSLCLISPILAAVAGAGFIVVIVSLSRPLILCYLVISATILTSGIERGRLLPVLSGNEVSLLGAFGIALLISVIDMRSKIKITRYYVYAMAILVGGTVLIPVMTFLLMGIQLTINNAFKMGSSFQYFILFWLFTIVPSGARDRQKIIWCMLIFGLLVAIVGLLQGFGFGPVNQILSRVYPSSHEEMAVRAGRITSVLGSWNSLGIFMMAVILITWAILLEVKRIGAQLLIAGVIVIAISALCLIASGSFAGVIGLAIGIVLLQILSQYKERATIILTIGVFGAILAIILFYPFFANLLEKRLTYQFGDGEWLPHTFVYRLKIWREIFIPAIQQHFPLPVYPTVPNYYPWKFEESQYILLLFRTGLVGFVSYLTWIGITIIWLYRRYRHSEGFDRAIASVALTIMCVLVVAGLTNEVFSFSGTIDYLWMMLALTANSKERLL